PTGYWNAKVIVGGATFNKTLRIETIKPNRLKIKLDFGKDKLVYGEDLSVSERIWLEDHEKTPTLSTSKRIGVDYAGEWALKPWRFTEKQ
ncbi:MAG TPA: DNA-3-methyladenine glycosylase, partial [Prolixibacteraceae bacterium]|nr:DNA-3-methyladenine glycosylase [Prolixibacteraceae bacterium]